MAKGMKNTLQCGCIVKSKKLAFSCSGCGQEFCSRHTYYYIDGSNARITKNSKGYCLDCYNKKYRRLA